jgi:hypothetical protein
LDDGRKAKLIAKTTAKVSHHIFLKHKELSKFFKKRLHGSLKLLIAIQMNVMRRNGESNEKRLLASKKRV